MTKKVPYKYNFDTAKKLDKWSNYLLWLSTIIIVLAFALKEINNSFLDISELLNAINCFFIIGYTASGFFTELVLYNANILKREDFIDNSCNSNFAEDK